MDEQLFWAKTLQQLGLAPSPLPAKIATANLLAERINIVLSDDHYLSAAHKTGKTISQRQGVSNAVDLIEKTFNYHQV